LSLTPAEGATLVRLAVAAIAARLRGLPADGRPPASAHLRAVGASFVTLESHGDLRGCIGTLEGVRPLYLDVSRNARRAMNDPRLPPVTVEDWSQLDVKVSVLSQPEPLPTASRAELVAALRPGIDGLILIDGGGRRATFLPAVWAKLPEPERFVAALLAKGGWPDCEWPEDLRAARYTSEEYADPAPRTPLEPAG
jgi:AmmeMemoRadiSam system protein A